MKIGEGIPAVPGRPAPADIPYRPQECWRRVDPALEREIVVLWSEHRVLPPDVDPSARAQEAVCVARDAGGRLVAVATARARIVPFLGESLYNFRLFVAPGARSRQLPLRMLRRSQRVLAADAAGGQPASDALGILLVLENPRFDRFRRLATWKRTGFVYAGRTPQGLQRRIWYFPGARLRG